MADQPNPPPVSDLGRALGDFFNLLTGKQQPPKEDWTDPGYVLDMVLAQLEELTAHDKRQVLIEALALVNDDDD